MNDWRSGVAIAALLLSTSPIMAQGQREGGASSGRDVQGERTPGAESKGAQEGQRSNSQTEPQQRDRAQSPDQSDGKAGRQRERAQAPGETDGKAGQPKAQRDQPGARAEDRSETPKKGDRQQTQREQRTAPNKDRAESPQNRETGHANRKNGDRPASTGAGSGEPKQHGNAGNESRGQAGAVQLSTEQRTQVRTVFAKHRSRPVTNLNVAINIGTHIPRTVHLEAVPEDVVVLVPDYRRYRYFVVDDRICVVDPDTYLIVDVIYLT